jgi:hypothetical protein
MVVKTGNVGTQIVRSRWLAGAVFAKGDGNESHARGPGLRTRVEVTQQGALEVTAGVLENWGLRLKQCGFRTNPLSEDGNRGAYGGDAV